MGILGRSARNIAVSATTGETRTAAAWVPPHGRARVLRRGHRRTLSGGNRGLCPRVLYDLIPTMPEARLRPLMQRFSLLLQHQPLFNSLFGVVNYEGSREGAMGKLTGLGTLKGVLAGALAIGMMTGPAFAVSIGGVGVETCSSWVADHQADPPLRAWQDEQWMIGYLSGAGKWGSADLDPLNEMDAQTVYSWISNYCAANPFAKIRDAGDAFIRMHPR